MAKRLLSHLLISLAIFSLVATFYVWFLDSVILNPSRLLPVLNDSGVPSALATLIPEKATVTIDDVERPDAKAKIAQVVTPDYVQKKMNDVATSMTTFMKQGSPDPVVDISDFPTLLRESGVNVGQDIDKNFAQPINLNKEGNLNQLPKYYERYKLIKYIGIGLFALLLLAEWFVADKGQRLKKVGRVFLHTTIWFLVFWATVAFLPARILPKIKADINDPSMYGLLDSVANAVKHLFGDYFLSFAVITGTVTLILYVLRRTHKHMEQLQPTYPEPTKGRLASTPKKKK